MTKLPSLRTQDQVIQRRVFLTLRESRRTAFSEKNKQVLTEVKEITDSLIMIFNSPQNVYSII